MHLLTKLSSCIHFNIDHLSLRNVLHKSLYTKVLYKKIKSYLKIKSHKKECLKVL